MEMFYLVICTDHGQEIVVEGDFETVSDALDNVWPEGCICTEDQISDRALDRWRSR